MFAGLSLNRKLLVLEIVSFAMLVLIAAFCLIQLKSTLNDDTENLKRLHADIDAMGHIESMNIAFLKEVKLAKDVWIRGADPEKLKKYRAEYVEQAEQFEKQRKLASSTLQELAQEHSGFEDFIKTLDSLATEHQNVSGKYLAQIDAHLNTADSDAKVAGIDRAVTKQITELRNGFATFIETKSSEKIELAESGYQQRRNIVIIAVLAALGTSLFLGSLIIRSVSRQLGGDPEEVAQVLHIMASGDFSVTAHKTAVSGSLLASSYAMRSQLCQMISNTKGHTDDLIAMSHTLASSATQIARSVNDESDSVATMASSIEEMSASTSHISERGDNAKEIASHSRKNAEEGAAIINRTVNGLLATAQEIEDASKDVSHLGEDASRISEIVKVIRYIADQTNLLALNAAIEAARAGEQGRGFAVVADEVRKLAERTSNATTEINAMSSKIGDVALHALSGMDKVVQTTRQSVAEAETAQTSIASIQHNFGEVSTVIDEISDSLAQQNSAANELAINTERIAQMSEENSTAADSLLRLAHELENKASEVRTTVDVFKV
jgi:methyl-accepting chemotaxis protein